VHRHNQISSRHPRGEYEVLNQHGLTGYDYVSISKDGFVSISVKPVIGVTWLAHDLV
jgi:hypothetical protein